MLALSVRQPWAWAIARGHKVIENRDWDTRFRGTLAIHASLSVDLDSSERPTIRAMTELLRPRAAVESGQLAEQSQRRGERRRAIELARRRPDERG